MWMTIGHTTISIGWLGLWSSLATIHHWISIATLNNIIYTYWLRIYIHLFRITVEILLQVLVATSWEFLTAAGVAVRDAAIGFRHTSTYSFGNFNKIIELILRFWWFDDLTLNNWSFIQFNRLNCWLNQRSRSLLCLQRLLHLLRIIHHRWCTCWRHQKAYISSLLINLALTVIFGNLKKLCLTRELLSSYNFIAELFNVDLRLLFVQEAPCLDAKVLRCCQLRIQVQEQGKVVHFLVVIAHDRERLPEFYQQLLQRGTAVIGCISVVGGWGRWFTTLLLLKLVLNRSIGDVRVFMVFDYHRLKVTG